MSELLNGKVDAGDTQPPHLPEGLGCTGKEGGDLPVPGLLVRREEPFWVSSGPFSPLTHPPLLPLLGLSGKFGI